MKTHLLTALSCLTLLVACDKKKAPTVQPQPPQFTSAADLKLPEYVPPPVETQPFEDGFREGQKAGELAGKKHIPRVAPKLPDESTLAVLALEAAGANPDRGPKWQRGFISGYRDGFEHVAIGLR